MFHVRGTALQARRILTHPHMVQAVSFITHVDPIVCFLLNMYMVQVLNSLLEIFRRLSVFCLKFVR